MRLVSSMMYISHQQLKKIKFILDHGFNTDEACWCQWTGTRPRDHNLKWQLKLYHTLVWIQLDMESKRGMTGHQMRYKDISFLPRRATETNHFYTNAQELNLISVVRVWTRTGKRVLNCIIWIRFAVRASMMDTFEFGYAYHHCLTIQNTCTSTILVLCDFILCFLSMEKKIYIYIYHIFGWLWEWILRCWSLSSRDQGFCDHVRDHNWTLLRVRQRLGTRALPQHTHAPLESPNAFFCLYFRFFFLLFFFLAIAIATPPPLSYDDL